LFTGKVNFGFIFLTIILSTGVLYLVMQNERMQRFTELQDMEMVKARIEMSLNLTFDLL